MTKKIRCKRCKGTGEVEEKIKKDTLIDICEKCEGKGYIEK